MMACLAALQAHNHQARQLLTLLSIHREQVRVVGRGT